MSRARQAKSALPPLDPALVAYVRALARQAAREDYRRATESQQAAPEKAGV